MVSQSSEDKIYNEPQTDKINPRKKTYQATVLGVPTVLAAMRHRFDQADRSRQPSFSLYLSFGSACTITKELRQNHFYTTGSSSTKDLLVVRSWHGIQYWSTRPERGTARWRAALDVVFVGDNAYSQPFEIAWQRSNQALG